MEFTITRGGCFTIADYSGLLYIAVPLTLSSLRSTLPQGKMDRSISFLVFSPEGDTRVRCNTLLTRIGTPRPSKLPRPALMVSPIRAKKRNRRSWYLPEAPVGRNKPSLGRSYGTARQDYMTIQLRV